MNNWFLRGDFGATPTNYSALIIALLLAFACGHAIAWIYMLTHSGLSYSRSYVTTLIIMPVIVAMVMLILANNLVLAFGLMAIHYEEPAVTRKQRLIYPKAGIA